MTKKLNPPLDNFLNTPQKSILIFTKRLFAIFYNLYFFQKKKRRSRSRSRDREEREREKRRREEKDKEREKEKIKKEKESSKPIPVPPLITKGNICLFTKLRIFYQEHQKSFLTLDFPNA